MALESSRNSEIKVRICPSTRLTTPLVWNVKPDNLRNHRRLDLLLLVRNRGLIAYCLRPDFRLTPYSRCQDCNMGKNVCIYLCTGCHAIKTLPSHNLFPIRIPSCRLCTPWRTGLAIWGDRSIALLNRSPKHPPQSIFWSPTNWRITTGKFGRLMRICY